MPTLFTGFPRASGHQASPLGLVVRSELAFLSPFQRACPYLFEIDMGRRGESPLSRTEKTERCWTSRKTAGLALQRHIGSRNHTA
jgi:hypothetical protein